MNNDAKALPKILAENLRRIRKDAGLTQDQLAERAGFSVQAVQKIENEDRWPGAETLAELARVLHISPASLFNAPVSPTPSEALEVLREAITAQKPHSRMPQDELIDLISDLTPDETEIARRQIETVKRLRHKVKRRLHSG